MAERQPEEEEGKFQCQLCPNAYKSAKSLKRHLGEKHADDPLLQEAKASVPKDTCPFCRQAFGNVMKHKRICKSNPDAAKPPGVQPARVEPLPQVLPPQVLPARVQSLPQVLPPQVQPAPVQPLPQEPAPRVPRQQYEGMSDDDLVQKFRDRMTKQKWLEKSSIKEYERHLKAFIQHEKRLDATFMAWRWFASGTKEQKDSRFVKLRRFGDYLEALITDQGKATVKQMMNVYSHINDWIIEEVEEQQQDNDPLVQLRKNKEDLKKSQILLSRGTCQPGQGRKIRHPVTEHLDVNITHQLLEVFVNSPLRGETLERFSQGDFTSPRLGMVTMQGAQDFLALLLYLENFGTRFDVVRNLTLGQLTRAQHSLDECPHCHQSVMYGEHKAVCLVRRSAAGYDKAKDAAASERVGEWWRIVVEKQKTQSKYGPVELNIRSSDLAIVRTFTRRSGQGENFR